jgi:hypothetical protein
MMKTIGGDKIPGGQIYMMKTIGGDKIPGGQSAVLQKDN